MAQLVPHPIPLRLTCLLAHCGDGLAAADLARLKTQLVQAYGFQHLLTWSNLLKLGLIKPKVLLRLSKISEGFLFPFGEFHFYCITGTVFIQALTLF
jgi:hypothetical protein